MNSLGQKTALQIGLAHFRAFALTLSIAGLIVVALVATGWQSFDEKIREKCEAEFNQALQPLGLAAEIESARFNEGSGIEILQLAIYEIDSSGNRVQDAPIANAKKVTLFSRASLANLIAGQFDVDRVSLSKPAIDVRRGMDGEWNLKSILSSLSQQQQKPFKCVPIEVEDGSIRIASENVSHAEIMFSKIQARISPGKQDASRFQLQLEGESDRDQPLKAVGVFDPVSGTWQLKGHASRVLFDDADLQILVPKYRQQIERIDSIRFATNFAVEANGTGFAQLPRFKITGSIVDGVIKDRQLPESISGVQVNYQVTEKSVRFYDGQATTGLGKAKFDYRQVGLLNRESWQLFGQLDRVTLHPGLRKLLPENLQLQWDAFSPAGTIDLHFQFWQNGKQGIRKNLKAKLVNASFEHKDIPYRLSSCVGEVNLDDRRCQVDFRALEAGQVVTVAGEFQNPGPQATGFIDVQLIHRLPINEKVFRALRNFPNVASIIKDFRPSGYFGFKGRLFRDDPNAPFDVEYDVPVYDCAIRYRHFDYPFSRISGNIRYAAQKTTFENFAARNGNGAIRCNGTYDDRSGLVLRFVCTRVPLDEQLRIALPEFLQPTWQDIHPKGTMNRVIVDLTNSPQGDDLQMAVEANAYPELGRPSQLSIRPSWFPYDIENLEGNFFWDRGKLTMNKVAGRHGRGWFTCNGSGHVGERDWKMTITELMSGSIRVDQPLLMALPVSIQQAAENIKFEGNVSVAGTMEFSGQAIAQTALAGQPGSNAVQPVAAVTTTSYTNRARWNLQIDTDNARMYIGMPVEKLAGSVNIQGASNDTDFYSRGSVKMDSGLFNKVFVSNLQGPFSMDRHRIAFGNRASWQRQGPRPQSMTGSMFDGRLTLDGEIRNQSNYPFVVIANLTDGSLKAAMDELSSGGNTYRGTGFASVTVYGNSSGTHSLRGQGRLRLRNAVIEIPLMERLGEVLPRQLDTATLDEGNIDFSIHGEDFDLNRIELIGNKISLLGKGKVNMEKETDIQLFTVVGRNRIDIPLLTDLMKAGSQQILLINIDGPIHDPRIEKEIPAVSDSLKLIRRDLELLQGNSRAWSRNDRNRP